MCLEEYRAVKGEKYSFCFFEALNEGNILDLSYNDINLAAMRRMLDDYQNMLEVQIFTDIISDPIKVEQYKRNDKKLRKAIKQKSESMMDKSVIEDAVAKQYLKMVRSCIYKKVDEKDDDKREITYKSFHILSDYLEKKGVTGIMPDMDKEVMLEIIRTFPEFTKYGNELLESLRETILKTIDKNSEDYRISLEIIKETQSICKEQLNREDITPEERVLIWQNLMEVTKWFLLWIKKTRNFMRTLIANMLKQQ